MTSLFYGATETERVTHPPRYVVNATLPLFARIERWWRWLLCRVEGCRVRGLPQPGETVICRNCLTGDSLPSWPTRVDCWLGSQAAPYLPPAPSPGFQQSVVFEDLVLVTAIERFKRYTGRDLTGYRWQVITGGQSTSVNIFDPTRPDRLRHEIDFYEPLLGNVRLEVVGCMATNEREAT